MAVSFTSSTWPALRSLSSPHDDEGAYFPFPSGLGRTSTVNASPPFEIDLYGMAPGLDLVALRECRSAHRTVSQATHGFVLCDPGDFHPMDASADNGLDLVAWLPMEDAGKGAPSYFCQCACGDKWEGKQYEAGYDRLERVYRAHFPPNQIGLFRITSGALARIGGLLEMFPESLSTDCERCGSLLTVWWQRCRGAGAGAVGLGLQVASRLSIQRPFAPPRRTLTVRSGRGSPTSPLDGPHAVCSRTRTGWV